MMGDPFIKSMPYHTHYCRASVHVSRDFHTGQVTVTAHIGTAPDDSTIIVYPYSQHGFGCKGESRKVAGDAKRQLREYINANGIRLTEPIEYSENWR